MEIAGNMGESQRSSSSSGRSDLEVLATVRLFKGVCTLESEGFDWLSDDSDGGGSSSSDIVTVSEREMIAN